MNFCSGPVLNLYLRDHAANEFYRKFTDSLQTPTDLLVTTVNTKRIGGTQYLFTHSVTHCHPPRFLNY